MSEVHDPVDVGKGRDLATRKERGKPAPLAMLMCRCGEPLIRTFVFTGAEFYCVACGRKYGWLGPNLAEPTPELEKRLAKVEKEWKEFGGEDVLCAGTYWLEKCERCKGMPAGGHLKHVTDDEREADRKARERLAARAGKP